MNSIPPSAPWSGLAGNLCGVVLNDVDIKAIRRSYRYDGRYGNQNAYMDSYGQRVASFFLIRRWITMRTSCRDATTGATVSRHPAGNWKWRGKRALRLSAQRPTSTRSVKPSLAFWIGAHGRQNCSVPDCPADAPRIQLGAEVLICDGLERMQELPLLCREGTDEAVAGATVLSVATHGNGRRFGACANGMISGLLLRTPTVTRRKISVG